MFRKSAYNETQATIDALTRSLAIIEFGMDGTILRANPNFLAVVGYDLDSLQESITGSWSRRDGRQFGV